MARKTMGESRAARRRGRPQGRKSFELVSPTEQVLNDEEGELGGSNLIIEKQLAHPTVDQPPVQIKAKKVGKTHLKMSASEKLAVRRQASSHAFHRSPMMSSEDYVYVKRDLVRIAILSVFMVAGIVVLYLLLGQ